MSNEVVRAIENRKKAAVTALFDYLFLVRFGRLAAYWEARLGEAIVMGEIEVKRTPKETGLALVHQVAAEVSDVLMTSEVAMVNAPKT